MKLVLIFFCTLGIGVLAYPKNLNAPVAFKYPVAMNLLGLDPADPDPVPIVTTDSPTTRSCTEMCRDGTGCFVCICEFGCDRVKKAEPKLATPVAKSAKNLLLGLIDPKVQDDPVTMHPSTQSCREKCADGTGCGVCICDNCGQGFRNGFEKRPTTPSPIMN